MIQLSKKTVEFPMEQKTQDFGRVAPATAVSRRQVPKHQTVQMSLTMLTEVRPVTQGAACVEVDHEVSCDAFAEWLKAISEGSQRDHPVWTCRSRTRRGVDTGQLSQQRSMNISRCGMQRSRSKQHNVRKPLRRTFLRNNRCAADSATVPEEYRPEVEMDVVSMAVEVTSVKTTHTQRCKA